jgi:hypothetical protein
MFQIEERSSAVSPEMPTPEEMREAVARYAEEIHRAYDEPAGPLAEAS